MGAAFESLFRLTALRLRPENALEGIGGVYPKGFGPNWQ
jgi:hypothetical protein